MNEKATYNCITVDRNWVVCGFANFWYFAYLIIIERTDFLTLFHNQEKVKKIALSTNLIKTKSYPVCKHREQKCSSKPLSLIPIAPRTMKNVAAGIHIYNMKHCHRFSVYMAPKRRLSPCTIGIFIVWEICSYLFIL